VTATEKYYKARIHLPETGAGPSPVKHRSLVVNKELEQRIGMVLSEERKFDNDNHGPSAFGFLMNNNQSLVKDEQLKAEKRIRSQASKLKA
jgi:hypothetical protein